MISGFQADKGPGIAMHVYAYRSLHVDICICTYKTRLVYAYLGVRVYTRYHALRVPNGLGVLTRMYVYTACDILVYKARVLYTNRALLVLYGVCK